MRRDSRTRGAAPASPVPLFGWAATTGPASVAASGGGLSGQTVSLDVLSYERLREIALYVCLGASVRGQMNSLLNARQTPLHRTNLRSPSAPRYNSKRRFGLEFNNYLRSALTLRGVSSRARRGSN